MKVAYLSPLPPVRSGVSEYSTDLLPALATELELRVFAEPPAAGAVAGLAIESAQAFDDATDIDVAVYHLGNNVHHRFIHERAMRRPGIAVFHDLVLHHFYVEETLARGEPDSYRRVMTETYGAPGAAIAEARIDDASSELPYFSFPLFEPVAARSRAVVVHNQRAARLIRARVEGLKVHVVAMGIPGVAADPLEDRALARRALGLEDDAFVVGLFGFTTPIKRPLTVLRAFAAARASLGPNPRLVVIGEVSRALDLASEARSLGVLSCLTLTDYIPYHEVKRWVAAADVFVNLRYPTAGETSASLLRLLGWGKTVVVSDYAQFRELPDDAVLKVGLGPSEEAELGALLTVASRRPDLRASLGAAATRHVAGHHSLGAAARAFASVVREVSETPVAVKRIRASSRPRPALGLGRPRVSLRAPALPREVVSGARLRLAVDILNLGDRHLLHRGLSGGGYAVLGGLLRYDNGTIVAELPWAPLGRDLAPGARTSVDWELRLPPLEGAFELVVDVKIAGYGWLHENGSEALVYRLDLTAFDSRVVTA